MKYFIATFLIIWLSSRPSFSVQSKSYVTNSWISGDTLEVENRQIETQTSGSGSKTNWTWFDIVRTIVRSYVQEKSQRSTTWNSLLRSPGLFPKDVDLISETEDDDKISHLKSLLEDHSILHQVYKNYKGRYHKKNSLKIVTIEERRKNRHIFVRNILNIAEHNLEFEDGGHRWQKGVNQFTDMREKGSPLLLDFEYEKSWDPEGSKEMLDEVQEIDLDWLKVNASDSIDWRLNGIIDFKARDQGHCGSCYSFVSISLLEAALALHKGHQLDLSEQEIIDCSQISKFGNLGCGGGTIEGTLTYLKNRGIALDIDYPYDSNFTSKSGKCRLSPTSNSNSKKNGTRVFGMAPKYLNINGDEELLKKAVYNFGPIAVGATVGSEWFQYHGGIFDSWSDTESYFTYPHAMLIVGYGRQGGQDYWLVKNTWGQWGEFGYMKLSRGSKLMEMREMGLDFFARGYFFMGAQFT